MVPLVTGGCVIGVDVGGTKLLAGTVDADFAVHHRAQRASQGLATAELLDALGAMVGEAADAAPGPVLGVGFGVPGVLDRRAGVVADCPHLPLEGVRFQALMAERLGIPVAVDNDANCALLAEWRHGAALGCDDAVMVTVGTGIGGGIVCGGALVRGATGGAAELGHMVVELDGPPCGGACPGRGHFEWYASGNAIGRAGAALLADHPESVLAREARAGREVTGALVTELAHDGDAASIAAITQVGRALGAGMVTLVNVFNPERIIVGGGAIAAGELLLAPARMEVAAHAMPSLRDAVEIVSARFGADAGMLGAATLAFQELGG
jgi:glucokinase